MTPEGSFEPTVMFFGLTNFPATFQAMMNELLRDLINTGKIAVFIDDVIIGTEYEEGHDELVVKIVDDGLSFIFPLDIFYFTFSFSLFSIFRTTWVRVDRSRCHISHNLMAKSQD